MEVSDNIDRVMHRLDSLKSKLPDFGLDALVPFHNAYQIVTHGVLRVSRHAGFAVPKLVDELDGVFANYYFDAIELQIAHDTLPSVWQEVVDRAGKPSYVLLLLGANAHINHDLAMALVDLGPTKLAAVEGDFFALDQVFAKVSDDILSDMYANHLLSKSGYQARYLYRRLVISRIISWRHRAWRNAHFILGGTMSTKQLEDSAILSARRISRWRM